MSNRSNINLVGNTTFGQNVGTGTGVYKGKNLGNILQYKSLQVTGTTMSITSDANNIYFSAATGGGGGTTYWSSGATGLSPAAAEDILLPASDLLKWSDDSCITSANSGLTMCNTTNHIRIDTTNIRICAPTIYLGQSAYYVSINSGSKLMCFGAPSCWDLNLCGGPSTDATAAGQVRLIGGGGSSTGCGGDICLCGGLNSSTGKAGSIFLQGGVSTSGTGGDVYLRGGDGSGAGDGTIYLDGANPTGGYGKLVLGSPTTNAAVDSQQIIACGLASNIGINISSKGTCGITLLTGKVALGNTSNAGFVFDCTNSAFCLPKNICICGAGGIGSVSCCDGWNIDMRGGFGSSNVGYAGTGGTICICGGCACLGSGGSGAKDGGSVVLHSGPGINGGVDGRIVLDNLPAKSSETCGVYIDASGNLSTGVISGGTGGGITGGTANYVPKWNAGGDNLIDSVIIDNGSSVDAGTSLLNIGASTTSGGNRCIKAAGSDSDIWLFLCSKGNRSVGMFGNCGLQMGTPSNWLCYNGDCLYKVSFEDFCIHGADNNNTSITANTLNLRGGDASNTNGSGGDIVLRGGTAGSGGDAGRVKICNLPAKSSETCGIYIDASGNLSTGVISGGSGGGSISGWTCASGVYQNVSIGNYVYPYTVDCFDINNVIVGNYIMTGATSASNNVAVGSYIMMNPSGSGSGNVGLGTGVLCANTTGTNNIGIGQNALCANTAGVRNVAIGGQVLNCSTDGDDNVGIGLATLWTNSTGCNNVAIGCQALYQNLTASHNIAIGSGALFTNCDGFNNVGIGCTTLYTNCIGDCNTAVGSGGMYFNVSGCSNTVMGSRALCSNTLGCYNTVIGTEAFCTNVVGHCNTALGTFAGFAGTGCGNVFLGYQAGRNETGNDKLYISNTTANNLVIGDFVADTICNGGNNTAWDTSSDCRIKECVEPISAATTTLSQLNPVTFDYTTGYSQIRGWGEDRRIDDYGFLAQEFETVFPQYVKCSDGYISSGSTVQDFRTINTGHLIPVLVKAIQELEARVQELESQ